MAKEPSIQISNVRQNNLKNVSLSLPLKKLTVITGVSGSGKSSLAFDTLYAEGSRRYMESLSTYARQFLEQIPRPEMDSIHNLPPAIALEQRNSITSSRTSVADLTEIYDYFRLLFAAVGKQNCRECGHDEVSVNSADSIAKRILALPIGTRLYVMAPLTEVNAVLQEEAEIEEIVIEGEEGEENPDADRPKTKKKKPSKISSPFLGQNLYQRGFQRLLVNGELVDLASAEGQIFNPSDSECFIVVDRLVVQEDLRAEPSRLLESVETALLYGNGSMELRSPDASMQLKATQGYSCTKCGALHTPPTAPLFSAHSPLGACPTCSGFGETLELDEELIVPDPGKTLRDGAVDPLSKPSYKEWEEDMLAAMKDQGVSGGVRYRDLTPANKKFLWEGDADFPGIRGYFETMKQWRYKLHVRVFVRRYQTQRTCPACKGSRLSQAPLAFRVGSDEQQKNIAEVLNLTVNDCLGWIRDLKLNTTEIGKAKEVLRQISERLEFLDSVGVNYLRLNRKGNSLSGGEYQRICLATQLGAKLSQTLYVLDEPSIGLHPSDTDRLIRVMERLRDHGNTVVVVEHETKVMLAADFLVELGPLAGEQGGQLIAAKPRQEFLQDRNALTSKYLSGELSIRVPTRRRPLMDAKISLTNCRENNLKGFDIEFPLGVLLGVTGVSGSGKSTLVHDTLYQALARMVLKEQIPTHHIGKFDKIQGLKNISSVVMLDQSPIGRSMRSNPATYIKAYDEIRRVMACQPQAARASLSPAHFSFNVDGGRCSTCHGEGYVEVDMHFMANIRLVCEECGGKRFKQHVLEVTYKGKNIDEILHTTVRDAIALFNDVPAIVNRLKVLDSVGLDYLQLGQGLDTLSGGECQRLKIAVTLANQGAQGLASPKLFIFDEPTTGLHMHDVKRLAQLFQDLVDQKHSVIFIEHNLDLIAQADWVIDMGPNGGSAGGQVVAQGTPEQVAKSKESITGKYLAEHLKQRR